MTFETKKIRRNKTKQNLAGIQNSVTLAHFTLSGIPIMFLILTNRAYFEHMVFINLFPIWEAYMQLIAPVDFRAY